MEDFVIQVHAHYSTHILDLQSIRDASDNIFRLLFII